MGCLNSQGQFSHWFGNVHLSGPCSRSCYFCIGQHMMAVDGFDQRNTWPLPGWDKFIAECQKHPIQDIFVTGTNTDPLLYRHLPELTAAIREAGYRPGIRTNGIGWKPEIGKLFDKGSLTICSTNPAINQKMMGGPPPDFGAIKRDPPDLKVNIVLGPENCGDMPSEPQTFPWQDGDLLRTLWHLACKRIERVNLREPYGQPHVGDPLASWPKAKRLPDRFGMPRYRLYVGLEATYWDVHYVEVESVNLYANGHVSTNYPVTRGVDRDQGEVQEQSRFPGGRIREQWQN